MLHLRLVARLLIRVFEMYKDLVKISEGSPKNCRRVYGGYTDGP